MRCSVVEARAAEYGGALDCALEGRAVADAQIATQLRVSLKRIGICGNNHVSCETDPICDLQELSGPEEAACLTNPGDPFEFEQEGYCYIDENKTSVLDVGLVVEHCRRDRRRMLRFSGENTLSKGSAAFLARLVRRSKV